MLSYISKRNAFLVRKLMYVAQDSKEELKPIDVKSEDTKNTKVWWCWLSLLLNSYFFIECCFPCLTSHFLIDTFFIFSVVRYPYFLLIIRFFRVVAFRIQARSVSIAPSNEHRDWNKCPAITCDFLTKVGALEGVRVGSFT